MVGPHYIYICIYIVEITRYRLIDKDILFGGTLIHRVMLVINK